MAIGAAGVLGACTVGPDYKRPDVTTPAQFRAQLTPSEANSLADMPWWSVFNDPSLQALISEAVRNNYDLQIAAARIAQAREAVTVAHSAIYPQVDYNVSAAGGRTVIQGENSAAAANVAVIGGGLNVSQDLDPWGLIRRSTEAARARLLAQEDIRRGVMLTLVTDVANGYFRLVELDRELAIADDSTRLFKDTFDLFTRRFQAGRDSNLPVQRAQANYDASRARSEDLRRQIAQQENALSILLGSYPKDIPRGRVLTEQTMPATPLSATSDLLERRPDIHAAEADMMAANADIGVAVANYFPRVGLSAVLGGQWVDVAGQTGPFGIWTAALAAAGPIFNGGRLRAIYRERKAFWDETVVEYRKTVIVAFQETSDALIAQQRLAGQRAALEAQVADLQRSAGLALTRYNGGRASYFEVIEAQQELFPAEDSLAQTQRDQLVATVNLYKALGGGWKLTPAEWAHPNTGG